MPEEITLKVQRLLAPLPPEAPAGWLVLNAPRPLMGSLQAGGRPCHWTADFAHGVFYAAVDPDNADGYTWEWLNRNAEDDGWLCEYVSQDYVLCFPENGRSRLVPSLLICEMGHLRRRIACWLADQGIPRLQASNASWLMLES